MLAPVQNNGPATYPGSMFTGYPGEQMNVVGMELRRCGRCTLRIASFSGLHCQFISPDVERVGRMPLDPVPAHLVVLDLDQQLAPKVAILHLLTVGSSPVVKLPLIDPIGDTVFKVDGVCIEFDPAAILD